MSRRAIFIRILLTEEEVDSIVSSNSEIRLGAHNELGFTAYRMQSNYAPSIAVDLVSLEGNRDLLREMMQVFMQDLENFRRRQLRVMTLVFAGRYVRQFMRSYTQNQQLPSGARINFPHTQFTQFPNSRGAERYKNEDFIDQVTGRPEPERTIQVRGQGAQLLDASVHIAVEVRRIVLSDPNRTTVYYPFWSTLRDCQIQQRNIVPSSLPAVEAAPQDADRPNKAPEEHQVQLGDGIRHLAIAEGPEGVQGAHSQPHSDNNDRHHASPVTVDLPGVPTGVNSEPTLAATSSQARVSVRGRARTRDGRPHTNPTSVKQPFPPKQSDEDQDGNSG